jgi:hypothetical protein
MGDTVFVKHCIALHSKQSFNRKISFMIKFNQNNQETVSNIIETIRNKMKKWREQYATSKTSNFYNYSQNIRFKLQEWIEANNFHPWEAGIFNYNASKIFANNFICYFDKLIEQWQEVYGLEQGYVNPSDKHFNIKIAAQNLFDQVKREFKINLIIQACEIQDTILRNQLCLQSISENFEQSFCQKYEEEIHDGGYDD